MNDEFEDVRTFDGRGIARAIIDAVEALPDDAEIVEFKAGENMQITCSFVTEDNELGDSGMYPLMAWTGETWEQIGWL